MNDEMEMGESGWVAVEEGVLEKSTGRVYTWDELESMYKREQDSDSKTED